MQEFRGTPKGHILSRCSFLLILGSLSGVYWDPLWRHVCDLSLIYGDPGMEMMPECSVCAWYTHNKKRWFQADFTFSSTYSLICCPTCWCLLVALETHVLILEDITIEIVIVIVGAIELRLPWGNPNPAVLRCMVPGTCF